MKTLDLCLLIHFLKLAGKGSVRVSVSITELATFLRRTDRTVQTSCKKLVRAGLIRRESVDPGNQFSRVETILRNKPLIEEIKRLHGPSISHRPKKSAQGRKGTAKPLLPTLTDHEKFPFRFLRDNSRRATEFLQPALEDGQRYWDWLSKALGSAGIVVNMTAFAQKRLLSTGERGGLVPKLNWKATLSGVNTPQLDSFAATLERTFHEGTFRIMEAVHPLLLVDDVSPEQFERLPKACALIETSPGSFQATLVAPRCLSVAERRDAQRALIASVQGDSGANTGSQLRRFPGSVNNKSSLTHAFISNVHSIPDALTLSETELSHLLETGRVHHVLPPRKQTNRQPSDPSPIAEALSSSSALQDPSAADFGHAIELLRRGKSTEHIIAVLINRAASRRKYGKGPGADEHRKYAELTLANARKCLRTATSQTRQPVHR